MIVFTSDHGEYLGCHHLLLKGNYMYDPLVKVPLIVKFPQSKGKGNTSQALVNTTDVAPTILSQAQCQIPERMRGLNLGASPIEREIVFAESNEGKQVMARTKTKKLILHRAKGVALFYDLENDPRELDNRHKDPAYQADIKSLTAALEKWRAPQFVKPRQTVNDIPKTYLDEEAPIIQQPNVPNRQDDHRKQMMTYAREKMQGNWAK
jgi:arylsulfatase A-like enzyme